MIVVRLSAVREIDDIAHAVIDNDAVTRVVQTNKSGRCQLNGAVPEQSYRRAAAKNDHTALIRNDRSSRKDMSR